MVPQILHDVWWGFLQPAQIYVELPLRPSFDGLVFLKHTTATRPTVNGAAAARQRMRF